MRRFIFMIGATLLMITVLIGACLVLSGSSVEASGAYPVVESFTQPDGSTVELRLWGDEFANGWETLDGYTVVKNQTTGYWEYAVLDSSGNLAPSGVVVDRGTPPAAPGLRPSLDALNTARVASGSAPAGTPLLSSPPAWAGSDTDILFILVEFTDVACTFTDADMQANLFGGGATGPGDLDDYFREISYGQLELDGIVEGGGGCYALAHDHDYYDQGPGTAKDVVIEAVNAAEADGVDFSIYDNDGNGYVDVVGIIYAGGGPHDGCETDDDGSGGAGDSLWPHSSGLGGSAVTVDGVIVDRYIIQSEITWGVADGVCDEMQTIGLFAHEFGHSLGLPDLYDTDGSSNGVGSWSTMASQFLSTVNLADTPPHYDPWSKSYLGWITPTDYTGLDVDGAIPQVETNPFVIQLLANPGGVEGGKTPGTGEYFLVENRQRVNFDSRLPGCGLLIWHIEESQATNKNEGHTTASHRLVDLEEADGENDLDRNPQTDPQQNRGDAGDPYPGTSNNRLFNDVSYPTANLYNGSPSGVRIADISDCGAVMLANFGNPSADVEILKFDTPDPVIAGEQLSYKVTVTNNGPASATNVMVTDVLPAGVTYLTNTDTCVEGPVGTLTCSLGDMLSGDAQAFTILVQVDSNLVATAGGPTAIINTATITADQMDSDLTNNEASAATIVEDEADLRLIKDCKPDGMVPAGEEATCTILVDNLGPSTARNAVLTDTYLSDGTFTFGTITTSAGSCGISGKIVTCSLGDLASGARATVKVPVSADEAQDINNHASVSSDTPDPDFANNQAEDSISVTAVADLTTTGTFGTEQQVDGYPGLTIDTSNLPLPPMPEVPNYKYGDYIVTAGRRIEVSPCITVNLGPSSAQNVRMEFLMPFGANVIPNTLNAMADPSGEPGRCYTEPAGELGTKVICQYDTLAPSESAWASFQVLIDPGLPDGWSLSISGMSRSDQFDPNLGNNPTAMEFVVDNWADLSLQKSAVGLPVAGQDITYKYEISNLGPSVSRDVTFRDFVPSQLEFVSAMVDLEGGSGGAPLPCSIAEGTNALLCPLGDIAPTNGVPIIITANFHIKASVPAGTKLTNNADVFMDTPDPVLDDNSASADVSVIAQADLAITKTSDKDVYKPSSTVKYTITVVNNGPSDAQNVVVTDNLPNIKQAVYLMDTANCTKSGSTLTCNLGTIAAGSSKSFNVYVTIKGSKGQVANTASVASLTTTDPYMLNNSSTRTVLIKGGK